MKAGRSDVEGLVAEARRASKGHWKDVFVILVELRTCRMVEGHSIGCLSQKYSKRAIRLLNAFMSHLLTLKGKANR